MQAATELHVSPIGLGASCAHRRRHGTPVSPNDLWIAASAAQHGLIVVTLDGYFEPFRG